MLFAEILQAMVAVLSVTYCRFVASTTELALYVLPVPDAFAQLAAYTKIAPIMLLDWAPYAAHYTPSTVLAAVQLQITDGQVFATAATVNSRVSHVVSYAMVAFLLLTLLVRVFSTASSDAQQLDRRSFLWIAIVAVVKPATGRQSTVTPFDFQYSSAALFRPVQAENPVDLFPRYEAVIDATESKSLAFQSIIDTVTPALAAVSHVNSTTLVSIPAEVEENWTQLIAFLSDAHSLSPSTLPTDSTLPAEPTVESSLSWSEAAALEEENWSKFFANDSDLFAESDLFADSDSLTLSDYSNNALMSWSDLPLVDADLSEIFFEPVRPRSRLASAYFHTLCTLVEEIEIEEVAFVAEVAAESAPVVPVSAPIVQEIVVELQEIEVETAALSPALPSVEIDTAQAAVPVLTFEEVVSVEFEMELEEEIAEVVLESAPVVQEIAIVEMQELAVAVKADMYTLFSYWSASHIAYSFTLPTPAPFVWNGSLGAIAPLASRKRSCDSDEDSASSPSPAKKSRSIAAAVVVAEELSVTLIDPRAFARHQLERKQRKVPVPTKPYSLLADPPAVVVLDSTVVEEIFEMIEEVESAVEEMEDVGEESLAMETSDDSTTRSEKHSLDFADEIRKLTRFNHCRPSSETRRWESVVFKRAQEVRRGSMTTKRSSAERRGRA